MPHPDFKSPGLSLLLPCHKAAQKYYLCRKKGEKFIATLAHFLVKKGRSSMGNRRLLPSYQELGNRNTLAGTHAGISRSILKAH